MSHPFDTAGNHAEQSSDSAKSRISIKSHLTENIDFIDYQEPLVKIFNNIK